MIKLIIKYHSLHINKCKNTFNPYLNLKRLHKVELEYELIECNNVKHFLKKIDSSIIVPCTQRFQYYKLSTNYTSTNLHSSSLNKLIIGS